MVEQRVERRRYGAVVKGCTLLVVFVMAMASSLASQAQPIKLTADMPMRPDALSQADYDAIVAEAKDISRLTQDTQDLSHWPAQWHSGLNPARLAALWSMPQSATLGKPERNVLVEQAADWDMLAFERPSDASVLWNRLWPLGQGGNHAAPNSIGWILEPDPNWSDNAVAMVSIFSCFPTVAWAATSDAAVWASMHNSGWQWRNGAGWDALRACMHETIAASVWPDANVPQSAAVKESIDRRVDAVANILKAKFTRELSKDGCSQQGPDSCLLIYQGLYALDRKNPQLAPILRRMERGFDLGHPVEMPPLGGDVVTAIATAKPAKKKHRIDLTDADRNLLDATLAEVERRKVFITLKLPVLLDHPEAWRRGELDRTLRQAMDLTLLVDRVQSVEHGRAHLSNLYFSDPWQWVDTSVDPAINASLRDFGGSYARSVGCESDGLGLGTRLQAFWQGYAIEVIRSGRNVGNCRAVYALRLPEVYQAAMIEKNAAASARDMSVFAPIDTALNSDGDIRTQALDAMTTTCAARQDPSARDPWKLCAGVAARDARQAEDERKRAADEQARLAAIKAAQPPPDPYACSDSVVMLAVSALGYKGDSDFWNGEKTACRLRPENTKEAIVVLTYTHGDEHSGKASDNNDTGYDVDVLVVRADNGSVVARNVTGGHIDSDAVSFDGIAIDTANYLLAPGERAFGVRIEHDAHCYQCVFGQTGLSLYLQRGKKLDDIMDMLVREAGGESDATRCEDLPFEAKRAIVIAPAARHGLADLLVTTTVDRLDDESTAVACPAGPDRITPKTDTLNFDGRAYPVPAEIDPKLH